MDISIFEIVGPIMIGPSSSHTAGMARIGLMAREIIGAEPIKIDLTLHKAIQYTYVGHCTDVALIGGVLGIGEHEDGIRNSIEIAKDRGIPTSVSFFPDTSLNPNTVQLDMVMEDGEKYVVRGISVGGGSLIISAIDNVEITLSASEYHFIAWSREDISPQVERIDKYVKIEKANKDGLYITKISFDTNPGAGIVKLLNSCKGIIKSRLICPVLSYGFIKDSKPLFTSYEEMVKMSQETGKNMAQLAIDYEANRSGRTQSEIIEQMKLHLSVMKEAAHKGLEEDIKLNFGLTSGRDGKMLAKAYREGKTLSGGIVAEAIANALGIMEVNGSMGKVVAAPTAGSCGIVPGCLLTAQKEYGYSEDELIDALLVSAITGVIMAHRNASFSGVVGGCQAEVGVSSAIAAAGLVSLGGGDIEQIIHGMAMAMKSLLGLICDPIAGPVEVPCIKRNAVGVANAFASADMAIAGIRSYIPPDEVIDALVNTQKLLPVELKGTTTGGLACTYTAKRLREQLNCSK